MPTYSHSKIGTFESCPQKYKFQYVDRIRSDIEFVEPFLGDRVHEALQKLYDLVRHGRIPDEQLILDYYEKQWAAHWNDGVRIVKPDLRAEDYRNVGRNCLQDHYRHYHPFHQGIVVALEMKISISLDRAGQFKMIGFIDRVDKTGDGVFEIHDYKTSQSLPSQEEKDRDRQLALYEIGLRDYFGGVNRVALVWQYLRFDHEIRSQHTEKELDELRAQMIAKIQEIEAATATGNFPPRESNLCNWCEHRPICPIWKHLYTVAEKAAQAGPLPDDGAVLVNQLADLERQRMELTRQTEELKAEQERIQEAIIQYARAHGIERVFGADRQAVVRRKTEWVIPTKSAQPDEYEQMVALLRRSPLWAELTDFSSAKLKEWLDKPQGQSLRAQLRALIKQEEQWRVSLRKKQDEE